MRTRRAARLAVLGALAAGVIAGWVGAGPASASFAFASASVSAFAPAATHAGTSGYVLVDGAGATTPFGDAVSPGSLAGTPLSAPIVDGDMTPSGAGAVLVASDGSVFAFGDAPYLGGLHGLPLNQPIVGVDVTPTGNGYVLAGADGGVFAFGDAPYRGSLGGMALAGPVVDIALDAANDGYRLAGRDGGVFAFGGAPFGGSAAALHLNGPIVAIMSAKTGPGYGLAGSDGSVFAFNGFGFHDSLGGRTLSSPIVDAVPSATGKGYNLAGADGGVFAFGDAPFAGSLAPSPPRPMVAILGLSNVAPSAVNDAYAAVEDVPLVVSAGAGVLGNDTDSDGDTLSAAIKTGPAHGAVSLAPNGSFTYTPAPDFNGADAFTYTASDPYGGTGMAAVALTVAAVNDAPVASAASLTTNEDTPGQVALSATDADGDPLTFDVASGPSHGQLDCTVACASPVAYTPAADYNGPDQFTYTANDGTADSNSATAAITVNPVNDPPVAADDAAGTDEGSPVTFDAVGNDSDTEGAVAVTALDTTGTKGAVTDNGDGTLTYDPNGQFESLGAGDTGTDAFSYTVSDSGGMTDVADVAITVAGLNDAPVASATAFTTEEDTPTSVALSATDADGDSLTFDVASGPSHGQLGCTAACASPVAYTPAADYNGPDQFTYTASDGTADSNSAVAAITVNAVNDPPVAADDAAGTDEASPVTFDAVANDSDTEGAVAVTALDVTGTKGTVTDNGDGTLTYDPNGQFESLGAGDTDTDTFSYTISDSGGMTDVADVAITVTGLNDAPVASATAFTTEEDTPTSVALSATDAEGDPLTFDVASGPSHGQLGCTVACASPVAYTPAADYNGPDQFTYTANDGTADSNSAVAAITVSAVNDPPVANGDAYGALVNTPLTVAAPGVLSNDTDPESQPLTAGNASDPQFGTVTLNSNGSFTYTPDTDYQGPDSFTYDLSDGHGGSGSATVSLTVVPPNATPTADATTGGGDEDKGPFVVVLTGHDADDDGLTFSVGSPGNGVVGTPTAADCSAVNDCTSSVNYSPNADFNGNDTFTYTVNDGKATSTPATATITVASINDAPFITKGSDETVNEDAGPQAVIAWATNPGAGAANESGQTVSVERVSTTNDALFSTLPEVDASNGNLTYTPAANANGSATVTIRAKDDGGTANGGTDTGVSQTFVINVTAVNDAPSFTKGGNQADNEDTPAKTVSNWATGLSRGPADEAGQALSFEFTANDKPGLFSAGPAVSPTGTLTYTLAANQYGTANLTLRINDDGGTANSGVNSSPTQSFAIVVSPVNDAPAAVAKSFTAQANMKVVGLSGLLSGATDAADVAGNASWAPVFTVGTVTPAICASCTISNLNQAAGTFDFDPPAGGTGVYTLNYTVVDNGFPGPGATSAAQTITITVGGPVIWFVDTAVAGPGTGRLSDPFKTLASATTALASHANERIFVKGGNVTGNVSLSTTDWVVSEAVTGSSFDSVMNISPPTGTITRPAINGTQRTLTGTVTLGTDSVVRGFDLTPSSGNAGLVGSGKTGLTVNQTSVTTTNARAVDLSTSSGTFSLKKVSATGADRGISLSSVNTSTGSFTVTGDGSTADSGGVITTSTAVGSLASPEGGVYLTDTKNVSLAWMTVSAGKANGIWGSNVTAFALTDSTVSNNGVDETLDHNGINFANLFGTSSMSRITVFGSREQNVMVQNSSGTATLTVADSTIRDNNATVGANGLLVDTKGSAGMTFTSTSNSFLRNRTDGLAVFAESSVKMTATITGGTYVTDNGVGLDIATNGTGGMQFTVSGGTVTGCLACGVPVNVYKGTGATGSGASATAGTISGMTVTNGNSPNAPGIWVHGEGPGQARIEVLNNNISQVAFYGIEVAMGNNATGNPAQSGEVRIAGNTVSVAGLAQQGGLAGIIVNSGTLSTDNTSICADIKQNSASSPDAPDITVGNKKAGSSFRLPDYKGSATSTSQVVDFLTAQNSVSDASANFNASNAGFGGGGACLAP